MTKFSGLSFLLISFAAISAGAADDVAEAPWVPDLGDGTYQNPVLAADYSDPDVTRVGDDYYLVSSSFTNVPGLPILHSRDLVNWTLIGHAVQKLPPFAHHSIPRRGGGVWAPAIRHHDSTFYIYYPDPDFGVFVTTATNPAGPWSEPQLVDNSRGAIDPCPFWDDDGSAWLIVAYAKSRAGFNNVLKLKKLAADGRRLLDDGIVVIDGNALPPAKTSNGPMAWAPIEGPKLYKRGGWYYIFAPAGGVKMGWQSVFRSRKITGPYEVRNVLDQGKSMTNGPHQGAWVTTNTGEDWFLHFQDADTYGRRVHLQPMAWKNDWPVIGTDPDRNGRGEPVATYRKPDVGRTYPVAVPAMNDEFSGPLSFAWQWHANPQEEWSSLREAPGFLRLKSVSSSSNLYEVGNLLTQKFPGPAFEVTTQLKFSPLREGEQAGLVAIGTNYAWVGLRKTAEGIRVVQQMRAGSAQNGEAIEHVSAPLASGEVYLRITIEPVEMAVPPPDKPHWPSELKSLFAHVGLSYSIDGSSFTSLGAEPFQIDPGRWVGATVGLFSSAPSGTQAYVGTSVGYADFDYFHVRRHKHLLLRAP
jgi:beta-xylosidase